MESFNVFGGDGTLLNMTQITKYALAESLKRLLLVKPLDKITINDITEDCGVNRMTFYYHFKDIYDLIEWICDEDTKDAFDGNKNYENWKQGYLKLFNIVKANEVFIKSVYQFSGLDHVVKYLFKLATDLLTCVVDEQSKGMSVRDEDKQLIIHFYRYSFAGFMVEWIENGMKEDPQTIIDRTTPLIQGNIKRALEAYRTDKPLSNSRN